MKPTASCYDYNAVPQKSVPPLTKFDSISSHDATFDSPAQPKGFWHSRRGRLVLLLGATITGCLVLAGVAVGIWAGVTKPGAHCKHSACVLPPQIDINEKPFGVDPKMRQVGDCGALVQAMQLTGGANMAWGPRNTFSVGFGSFGRAAGGITMEDGAKAISAPAKSGTGAPADYSGTNVQVEGVDESDVVKTDGQYIYVASGGQLVITRVTGSPASVGDVGVTSRTNITQALAVYGEGGCSFTYNWDNVTRCGGRYGLAGSFRAGEMLLNGDILLLLGSALEASNTSTEALQAWGSAYNATRDPYLAQRTFPTMAALTWNISNRSAPQLLRVAEVEGYFSTGRLVDGVAYVAVSTTPHVAMPVMLDGPITAALTRWQASVPGSSAEQLVMPHWRTMSGSTADFAPVCNCSQVSFPPNITSQSFLTVLGIALEAGTYDTKVGNTTANRLLQPGEVIGQTTVAGPWSYGSPSIMASPTSLYMAVYHIEVEQSPPPPARANGTMTTTNTDQAQVKQGTLLLAFSLSKGLVSLRALGQVPGNLISQWAMDEYSGALRVASTVGPKWVGDGQTTPSVSGVFVLNSTSMQQVGSVVGLGVGERIYAVRFMTTRGYVVTFRQTDPLYVVDLTRPDKPTLMGELKIPGFSDYLHPVGASMLMGIGKSASDTGATTGLKLSLFDVSNPTKPIEAASLEMGGPGSFSEVSRDHKALMYFQPNAGVNRAVLSLPVTLRSTHQACTQRQDSKPVTTAYQGVIVYELTWSPGKGAFNEVGRISHTTEAQMAAQWPTVTNGQNVTCDIWCEASRVRRSIRVGTVLYTMSDSQLVASRFDYNSSAASSYSERLWGGGLLQNLWESPGQPQPCWIYTALD